jgi:hypothetical protein
MSGYGDYAATYRRMGWPIFPLPDGEKFPPPSGRTGRNGRNASLEEIETEAADQPNANIATRLCGGLIGIDVDAYDGKPGAATFAALIGECGDLPRTVISTSRDDGVSGIRVFRVPEGVEFITKLPGIEIVQAHHRYALVWPSTHDKTGRLYQWIDSETGDALGMIPHIDNIPDLPERWLDRLRAGAESNNGKAAVEKTDLDRALAVWCSKGEPCSHMAAVINDFRRHVTDGEARHDSALQAQLAIIRYGEAGHTGGRTALAELKRLFFEAIGGDRDVSKEWRDGIIGAGQTVMAELTPDGFRGCEDDLPEEPPAEDDTADPDDLDDGEPEDDDGGNLARGRDGRRRINVRNKKTAGDLLRSLIGADELSGLFHRDGELVYCPRIGDRGYIPTPDGSDDGPAQVRIMLPLDLKTKIEIAMSPGAGRRRTVTTTDDDGEEIESQRVSWEPKMLPLEVANHVHNAARTRDDVPNLRTLAGVTHTPIMRPDGSIISEPGYDSATRLLYLPTGGLVVPELPSPIMRTDIGSAVGFLKEIVAEFPFVEEHHRANWFGALFTPFMRAMLPPPYPAFVIDAPSPGSGKSYLASILRTVHGGVIRTGWPSDDAEFGKSVLSILVGTTAPVVTFDNVRGKIRSSKFEGLLTSSSFSDRLLGQSREASGPNDRLWTITANNAEIGGDLARRCYWITIDPKMPRPHERTGFALDLRTWPQANRGEIIRAILTIIRGWVLAGSPSAELKRSDDYAVWDAAIEGLLNWAGFSGQFGFKDVQKVESDDDREWGDFVSAVYRTFGSEPFRVRDITARLKDSAGDGDDSPFTIEDEGLQAAVSDKIDPGSLPGELADKWSKTGLGSPAGFSKSLGRWIKNRAGRYVGDLAFQHVKADAKKGDIYRIDRFA